MSFAAFVCCPLLYIWQTTPAYIIWFVAQLSCHKHISRRFTYFGFGGWYKPAYSEAKWVHTQVISLVLSKTNALLNLTCMQNEYSRIWNFKTQPIYFNHLWDTKLLAISYSANSTWQKWAIVKQGYRPAKSILQIRYVNVFPQCNTDFSDIHGQNLGWVCLGIPK